MFRWLRECIGGKTKNTNIILELDVCGPLDMTLMHQRDINLEIELKEVIKRLEKLEEASNGKETAK